MAKKPISQKRAEREQKENQTLHKVFRTFLLGLAAECYLLIVYRGYAVGTVDSSLIWHNILTWGTVAGAVLAVVGAALLLLLRRHTDRTGAVLRKAAVWGLGLGVFLAVSGWSITRFAGLSTGVISMCILVPILTVMALIFLLYQHECFLCTVALSGTLFVVWARGTTSASTTWRVPVIAGAVLGAALLAAAAAVAHKARQNGGRLRGVRIFTPECDYRVLYGVLAAGFLCVLAVLALPALSYYIMWAAGILLFAELVFYTTKLM